MPFEERWFIENDMIYVRAFGDLNLEETERMVAALLQKTEASSAALVHVLLDIRELKTFPRNIAALNRITRPHLSHPKYGWALAYGQNTPLIQFVGNTVMQLTQTRFRIFPDQTAALTFIYSVNPALRQRAPEVDGGAGS